MAGNTDEANEAIFLGLGDPLQSAACREGRPPLVLIDEVVQLDQINLVR
jgi:hypothetical protein